MVLRILSTNIKLVPSIEVLIDKKIFGPVKRLLQKEDKKTDIILDVEVGKTGRHQKKGEVWFCESNLSVLLKNKPLRVRAAGITLEAAINKVKDGFENEIKKQKNKRRSKMLRGARSIKSQ